MANKRSVTHGSLKDREDAQWIRSKIMGHEGTQSLNDKRADRLPDREKNNRLPDSETIKQPSDFGGTTKLPGVGGFIRLANHDRNHEVTDEEQQGGLENAQDEVERVDIRGLTRKAADWAHAHPVEVATCVGMIIAPTVVAPVVGAVGFGGSRIIGGTSVFFPTCSRCLIFSADTAVPAHRASRRPVLARAMSATWQSARAGGYDVPIVDGIVRAGGALTSALSGVVAKVGGEGKTTTDEKSPVCAGDEGHDVTSNPSNEDEDEKEAEDLNPVKVPRQRQRVEDRGVRSSEELSSLLLLSSTNRTPLITLWTASWCSSCRAIKPLLLSLIEEESIGEREGGVGYAEVEIDSPNIGPLASRYFVNSIPTLLSFRAQEAALEEKVVSVDEMRDREFMTMWIENEARRGGDRGGGGGMSTGLFGGLFGIGEK
ncbi:MAG: hypothetical protein Q9218_006276 [Villophora microphyllina]